MTALTTRAAIAVVQTATMSAMPTNRTVAAAVCPDGKLEVAGVEFMRGTAGRGRPTMNVMGRNTVISMISARIRKAASRNRFRNARKPAVTAAKMMTGNVSSDAVANWVIEFHGAVR